MKSGSTRLSSASDSIIARVIAEELEEEFVANVAEEP